MCVCIYVPYHGRIDVWGAVRVGLGARGDYVHGCVCVCTRACVQLEGDGG